MILRADFWTLSNLFLHICVRLLWQRTAYWFKEELIGTWDFGNWSLAKLKNVLFLPISGTSSKDLAISLHLEFASLTSLGCKEARGALYLLFVGSLIFSYSSRNSGTFLFE